MADYGDDGAVARPETAPVLCIASRSPLDEAASLMLVQLLEKQGLQAVSQPFADVAMAKALKIDVADAPLVCLSYFGAGSNPAHVRYLIRRMKRRLPKTKFLACYWLLGTDTGKSQTWKTSVGADFVATSLSEAVEICVREAGVTHAVAHPNENGRSVEWTAVESNSSLAPAPLERAPVPG